MPIPESIAAFIDQQAKRAPAAYDDLRVVIFNGTTKRSPEPSHTDGLLAIPRRILTTLGVRCNEAGTCSTWRACSRTTAEQEQHPNPEYR
jgi:hypothetical protein